MTKISIALFVLLTAIGIQMAYWQLQQERKEQDPKYNIKGIYQTTSSHEMCPPRLLSQILELYHDKPENIFQFDTKWAEKALLSTPWIREATVEKLPPDMLFVDYTLREPVAYVADWKNRAIDKEGNIFASYPIYTPKRIPSIYFGDENYQSHLPLCFELLESTKGLRKGHITMIDLSKVNEMSLGRREITLVWEQEKSTQEGTIYHSKHFLRLPAKEFEPALHHYKKLLSLLYMEEYQHISSQNVSTIVDLRLENLAFIKYEENHGRAD